jgi:small subunit ribosomal protein S17
MKVFSGKVVSTKMHKTATVEVERFVAHPIYRKRLKKIRKYQVHDEMGAKVGQSVRFVACAPISKLKKWKVIEVSGVEKLQSAQKREDSKPKSKGKKKGKK